MSRATSAEGALPVAAARPRLFSWAFLGVLPFFLFAFFFLILPTSFLMVGAFQDAEGRPTLANIRELFHPTILQAYWISIQVSTASAIGGAIIGFFVAYAAIAGGLPRWVRPTLLTFSGVASNFAGVPLAFAFLATLGRLGLVTVLLVTLFDFNIYRTGFNLLSFWGLALTYMYFQIPLMVLIMAPAIDGLRREWREAASNLGGSAVDYWRYVALPVLWPTLLGTTLLLFANALGYQGKDQFTLAATVEFIHTATLLHDDVVDESSLRRGRQTANAVFGNAASVLVGDFLYSRAFQMMVSTGDIRVLHVLAEATNVIAEGEVLQLMNMHDPDLAVEEYLRVIRSKTAKLFEASSRLGAMLARADQATEEACASYGRSLGTAMTMIVFDTRA